MTSTAIRGFFFLLAVTAMAGEITVSARTPRGAINCQSPGEMELIGSGLKASQNSFVLDLCLPTQECSAPIPAEFSANAPGFAGFDRYLRQSEFIRVYVAADRLESGCAQRMSVQSVASWVGARNPSGRGDELYFAAGDDSTKPLGSLGFELKPCVEGNGTLGLTVGKTRVTLRAGAERKFSANDNAPLTARLLSAGRCNSSHGWSYWLAGRPAL